MDHAVLIVDDEPKIYHALRRALHREPYDIVYASGGEEALKLLGERQVDVIVADQNMPNMQGSVLLARVRQQYPDVVRMMLTGDARLETVMAAVNKGEIYRFFTKPCNEAELIISIRDALQMRALKFEAGRLLETVKKQNAQLQSLQSGEPAASGTATGEPAASAASAAPSASAELPPIELKQTGRATRTGPATSDPSKGRYVIDAGKDIPQDVDKLLDEIRSELERLELQ
jgi:two-component system, probable response regulator PhcQ